MMSFYPTWYLPGSAELDEHGPVKTVFLVREPEENLGFSVRGGSEHGLGIYVSEITEESPAGKTNTDWCYRKTLLYSKLLSL